MILCEHIRFTYPGESFELAFDSFAIGCSEQVALVGPSGCGKTTLLNLVAGVLLPQAGSIEVNGTELGSLSLKERQAFRLTQIGMVPQNFELLDYLTVKENLLTPIRLAGTGSVSEEQDSRATELAGRTGIESLLRKYPSQLSQGERQRVAMCRGLMTKPCVILADEPTGNLDPGNQDKIVSLLLEEAKRLEASLLMITHEPGLLSRFDRTIDLMELHQGGKA